MSQPAAPDKGASQKPIRIFLIDDHSMMRVGLRHFIQLNSPWDVCGEASTAQDALAALPQMLPDVVVLDFVLPDMNGLELLRRIKKLCPDTEVVVYTAHDIESAVVQAFDGGARSYLTKSEDTQHLLESIEAAAAHKPYFTQQVSQILFRRLHGSTDGDDKPVPGSDLTPREAEAIKIIAKGASNKDLALALGVGLRTAEGYRSSIMRKLQLHTIGELIRYALRNGIIED